MQVKSRLFQAGGLAAAGFLAGSTPVHAAPNLLTVNPSFESNAPFINATGDVNGIPGWHAVMADTTPGNYNSFVGAAGDQPNTTGRDGANFGYYHGAIFETSAASRAPATPGTTYQLSLLLKNDQDLGDTTPTQVTLAFYNNNSTYRTALPGSLTVPVSLVSTKINGDGGGAFTPQTFTAVAPAGATFAGIELNTTGTYILDNVSISVVPEPGMMGVGVLTSAGLLARRRRRT